MSVAVNWLNSSACSGDGALLRWRVSLLVKVLMLLALCSISGSAGEIRLRNELIQTPDKKAAAAAPANELGVSGLYLVQFKGLITDQQRAELARLNVELLNPAPENAYVARLTQTRLGALRAVDFVHWVGPLRPEHKIDQRLAGLKDKQEVNFLLAPGTRADEISVLRKGMPGLVAGPKTSAGTILRGSINLMQLAALARSQSVLWIEPAPKHRLFDEMSSEIVMGELEGPGSVVQDLGFDGKGVVVAVTDSGLMEGSTENMHPDLAGRVDAFFHYGRLEDAADEHGHGTHVAGIVAGNGATGEVDEFGNLYGLGVAPKAHIIAQRMFDGVGGYEPPDNFEKLTRDAVQAGAVIGSNSWGDDTHGRYDLSAMQFDALVRDADGQTPGDQQYILEFSAGNAGPGEQTIGSPAVGKNVIATGASQNNRLDFLIYAEGQDAMADFSSRGPCEDGRIKPDIVAPGTWIASLQSSAATDENAWLPISFLYQYQGGTSQAGPHASGAAAVFVQYYRETQNGRTPSPALVKAALINSAADMDSEFGTRPIPNNDEGWGRIDLEELIASDRSHEFIDQSDTLTQGQIFERHIHVVDYTLPLRITLAYTDVPGTPLVIPSLVNDLDLEVIAPDGAVYAGNQMIDGESAPQPAARDNINNVECVYLQQPVSGEYIVRVRARRVAQDARRETQAIDQDFALVISGGLPEAGHALISFDRRAYTAPSMINLKLIDPGLAGQQEAIVQLTSDTESTPIQLRMTASGTAGVFTGVVATAKGPAAADDTLQIAHDDIITVTYEDVSPAETIRASRRADLIPPVITNVASTNRFGNQMVTWSTDERADSLVRYGITGNLNQSVFSPIHKESHALILTNLIVSATYQYVVASVDEAGNATTNDNNGQKFTFRAQPAAPVLLVNAYVHSPDSEATEIPLTEYTDALDGTGVAYEVWDVATEGEPLLADLLPFRVVIWRINDSFYDADNTLTLRQQQMLQDYIHRDGSLLIASMELLTRIGDTPFRTNVLQVAEFTAPALGEDCPTCDQDHGMDFLEGLPGDSIGSGVELAMDYSLYPAFIIEDILQIGPDFTDTFTANTNAVPIFVDQNSQRTTGIRWPRDLKGPGRVVFLAFPLDAIPMEGDAPNNRVNILRNILAFLAPGVNGLGTLSLDRAAYTIPDQVVIEVADSDLSGKGSATVKLSSETVPIGIEVRLLESPRKGVFSGAVTLISSNGSAGPNELRVADGNTLQAQYFDASARSLVRVSADIDASAPAISGREIEVDYEFAIIRWETDEFTDSLVQYGESTFLGRTAFRSGLEIDHELTLNNLLPDRAYYYQIVSRDAAGNAVIDDNAGKLYMFRTKKPRALPWTDSLEGPTTDWTVESTTDSEWGWERGTPANGLDTQGHSGTNVWASNLNGVAGTYTETALASPALLLNGGNRATLTLWQNYDFTVNADVQLVTLFVVTNSQTAAIPIASYDGASAGWEMETIDLSPYIGRVVQLVWFYQVLTLDDPGEPYRGWMIDDVSVTVRTESRGGLVVHANLSQAVYNIDGPSPAVGQGMTYTNTAALSGAYTFEFQSVPFYKTPPPKTGQLEPGGYMVIEGKYEITDSNANGIADEWEQQYFGEIAPDPNPRDFDHDGSNDYCEFIAGTNPADPSSRLGFEQTIFLPDGRLQLTWSATAGRAYRILGTGDMVNWTPYTNWVRSNGTRQTQILPPLGAGNTRFFQVQVAP